MRRDQLEHVLRAASRITGDEDLLVIGSQSVLGSFPHSALPAAATGSIEVDIALFDDPELTKADLIDGGIGEGSHFHDEFGIYAQGVSLSTAVLADRWRLRLVVFSTEETRPGRGLCLERHDCVLSKLVAGRQKDHAFANALADADLLDMEILAARTELLPVEEWQKASIRRWLKGAVRRAQLRHGTQPPKVRPSP